MPAQRRRFAQYEGAITTDGEPELAELLRRAWTVARVARAEQAARLARAERAERLARDERDEGGELDPGDEAREGRELTHGFHPYPAQLHPLVARTLIATRSRPGELVVDPFCGSGTMLVEATAAGRRAFGGDVNGVAVRLAWLKTRLIATAELKALVASARKIAWRAGAFARDTFDETIPIPADLARWFDPHVLVELHALGVTIDEEHDAGRHAALVLVLSSLLTKVSRRAGETTTDLVDKRLAEGFVFHSFVARAAELAEGLQLLARAARGHGLRTAPAIALADARTLPIASGTATLVITSPPYLGTYDYDAIQELRTRLLQIPQPAAHTEIGRRSSAEQDPRAARAAFEEALAQVFREMARVLKPGGEAIVVLGDSVAGREQVPARPLLERAVQASGLRLVASASQLRPAEIGPRGASLGGARHEHLFALRRS